MAYAALALWSILTSSIFNVFGGSPAAVAASKAEDVHALAASFLYAPTVTALLMLKGKRNRAKRRAEKGLPEKPAGTRPKLMAYFMICSAAALVLCVTVLITGGAFAGGN